MDIMKLEFVLFDTVSFIDVSLSVTHPIEKQNSEPPWAIVPEMQVSNPGGFIDCEFCWCLANTTPVFEMGA